MPRLIFDIETIGEDFDTLDETSQHMLTRWIEKTSNSEEEYKAALEDIKQGLGFSPLTGQIVAIGVLDGDTDKGAVYYQSPDNPSCHSGLRAGISNRNSKNSKTCHAEPRVALSGLVSASSSEQLINDIKFKICTEKEILEKFWELAKKYNEFVSFNGRCFDVPFLIVRSAIHKIKPTKDLLSNRYIKLQSIDCKHIDLLDQLSFYGAFRPKGSNLHMWCRAFGIESPKASGVDGDDVAALFKHKKYLEIAKYNALDIRATKKLYDMWNTYIRV